MVHSLDMPWYPILVYQVSWQGLKDINRPHKVYIRYVIHCALVLNIIRVGMASCFVGHSKVGL